MDMIAGMLTMTSLDLVALAAVVLIGLPHGALDGAIAMHLGYANKILNFISFIVLYVLMAGLVVALWIVMPAPCLLAFLMISMIHFGSGDARHGTGWMRGAEILAWRAGGRRYKPDAPHRGRCCLRLSCRRRHGLCMERTGRLDGLCRGVSYCLRQPRPSGFGNGAGLQSNLRFWQRCLPWLHRLSALQSISALCIQRAMLPGLSAT